ncbi:hypothetical protein PV646_19655 [Streptomyces sp. ID05-26A]|nr:hypothetical protein [Streptomyces sp. ID05-26A]
MSLRKGERRGTEYRPVPSADPGAAGWRRLVPADSPTAHHSGDRS